MSSNVDERTARELYGPPYAAAVDSGVGTVMCAFVRVNNTQACESAELLNEWLYSDLGFKGAVVSDWTATHSTVASALNGLTVEMEWQLNSTYFGSALVAAVTSGAVPLSRLDMMATRLLSTVFATTDAGDAPPSPERNTTANVTSAEHAALARELAVAGTVLLKNDPAMALLPLEAATLCRVVIIGEAASIVAGGGSGGVVPPYVVTPEAGLIAALPGSTIISLEGANATAAAAAAADADVAIVFVGMRTSEGMDRSNLSLPFPQDDIVRAVLAAQPKTVVVARCSGACLLPWAEKAPSIISQLYAGQEAGNALADVLLGARNPAGKLTVTWPLTGEDTWLSPPGGGPVVPSSYPGTDRGRGYPEVDYAEGLFVGYRWFDAHNATPPLFPFGHGLSYTTFSYSNVSVTGVVSATSNATLSFTVVNDASVGVAGAEVAQVYIGGVPGDPIRGLKAFSYTGVLAPGQKIDLSFDFSAKDLAIWSNVKHSFVTVPPADYPVWIGSSSRDFRLTTTMRVAA
jgi:beta-glucosidase